MSKLVLILLATSVGLGLLSLFLVNMIRTDNAIIMDLQSKVAALEEQLRKVPPPGSLSTFVEEPPAPPAESPEQSELRVVPGKELVQDAAFNASGSYSVQPPSREAMKRAFRESQEQQRQLMQDPEYREAMRLQARANFVRQYPGVIQELGMDQKQASEFFDLLAEQQQRTSEQMNSLWEMEGLDPAAQQEQRQKVHQRATDLQREQEAEFAAKLGPDKLQAWKQYQSTLGARYQLEQMRNALASQGTPLSDDASKSLLRAMADVQKAAEAEQLRAALNRGAAPGGSMMIGGPLSPEQVEQQLEASRKRNQRTLDAISPYLTPEQRETIEREQEAQLKLQAAHMRLQRWQRVEGSAGFIPRQ